MDINELNELLGKGYGGRQLTSLYTGNVDSILKDIFYSTGGDSALCLIAIGGYGRGELAPFSDIDIMLFARDRSASEKAKELLYRLWDRKLDISHSFRTPADCINEARKDIRTKTSLLENRYIAGDISLYRHFNETVYPEIAFRGQKEFVSEKLREIQARHRKFGDSVYMLEPNIKAGRGGLRDIQTVVWLAGVKLRIRHFDELSKILTPENFKRLCKAYDFLLKVRFCLHLLSERKNDILSFEYHNRVADMLGFKASERFLSSERFMRYLYLKESVINGIASSALDIISTPYGINRRSQESYLSRALYFKRKITEDFYISKDRIAVTDGVFRKDPDRIIEAFYIMSRTGKMLSARLREEIRKNLFRISRKTRSSHNAIEWFLGIIKGERIYETLREMHDCGVLGRLIPEFGALSFLVVYELYHAYTVDEHTLNAIRNLLAVENTRYKNLENLTVIFRKIKHREALILSLLLHDIGKSAGGYHEEVGYRDLKNIIERFNLNTELRSRVEFLVKNHTLMSAVAFRKEIDDPEVIAQFADEVADGENLDALYLLTYADMAAVSPDFWTDWKAYLLRELYEGTLRYLEGSTGISKGYGTSWGDKREGVEQFLSHMPERYVISTPPEKIYSDYCLYLDVIGKNFSLNVTENAGGAEITVGAWDRPGLFSRMVGVLSSMGMNIYRARVYTGKGGIVIDRVQVSNWKELWWDGMVQLLEGNLKNAVCGDDVIQGYADLISSKKMDVQGDSWAAMDSCRRFGPFIEIDNETSADNSILEFFARDRLGLLYDATSLMHEKGIDIISARINTESRLANDIFYIQKEGKKIDGINLYELILALWARIVK